MEVFFEKAIHMREMIESNIEEIKRLRMLAEKIPSADPSKEFVSGGPRTQCKYADIVEKLIDLERQIYEETENYILYEKEVRDKINMFENMEWRLYLRYKYIEGLSTKDIATKLGYSPKTVSRLHKKIFKSCP